MNGKYRQKTFWLNRKQIYIIWAFLSINNLLYSGTVKGATPLSGAGRAEIFWAIVHPFKVKKARQVSRQVLLLTDSIEESKLLSDGSGGPLDAFKHCLWMALLSRQIGTKAAFRLGLAHEKTNYRRFQKGRSSSSYAYSKMDSLNNVAGLMLYDSLGKQTDSQYIAAVLSYVDSGRLFMLSKSPLGQVLNCKGQPLKEDIHQWKQGICIIRSQSHYLGARRIR